MRGKILPAFCAAALAAHFAMGLAFMRSAAPTFDEGVHLSTGYFSLVTGNDLSAVSGHPPFARMLDALPLLAYRPELFPDYPRSTGAAVFGYGDLFLYRNTVPAEKMLGTARVFSLALWSGLLAFFIWLLVSGISGPQAGAYAVAAFALMPVFISNNALVTTDAASAAFYFGAFCMGYLFSAAPGEETGKKYLYAGLAGLISGFGMASKFSLFIIPPLMIALWSAYELAGTGINFDRLARYAAAYLGAVVAALALAYRLDLGAYYSGLMAFNQWRQGGHSSFIWGTHSLGTVRWYFPFALAVKTPLPALALAAAGLAAVIKEFRKEHIWLLLPPAVFFGFAMCARAQIGVRHILPVMPFLAALAGIGAAYAAKRKLIAWLLAPLLLLWGLGLARTWPHYLAYFNELTGGPANGYKFLVDSNLDWGQDVKTLASKLQQEGNPPVVFSYFGMARPERYGIKYVPLAPVSHLSLPGTGEDVCGMKRLLLAVSATNLQSTYYFPDKNLFDWLKGRRPVSAAGYSIFLYDLTDDSAGIAELAAMFGRIRMDREARCLYEWSNHVRK